MYAPTSHILITCQMFFSKPIVYETRQCFVAGIDCLSSKSYTRKRLTYWVLGCPAYTAHNTSQSTQNHRQCHLFGDWGHPAHLTPKATRPNYTLKAWKLPSNICDKVGGTPAIYYERRVIFWHCVGNSGLFFSMTKSFSLVSGFGLSTHHLRDSNRRSPSHFGTRRRFAFVFTKHPLRSVSRNFLRSSLAFPSPMQCTESSGTCTGSFFFYLSTTEALQPADAI